MRDQGILITGCITIVLVLAQLKLFSIAKTLKEILEELKQTRRTIYALTTKVAPTAIAPEGPALADPKRQSFVDLADRYASTENPEEQRRLKEDLDRRTFGE